MTQINSSIPNLIGGVSQQPELLRLPSHLKAQENSYCSPAKGLSKRPPTSHLGKALGLYTNGFYQTLDYGPRGIYHLNINPSGYLNISNSDGTGVPIYDSTGAIKNQYGYLAVPDPATQIKAIKEADTTFLLNTTRVVNTKVTKAPSISAWVGLVWVKVGNYGRTYSITLPGEAPFTYTTPNGSDPSHLELTTTDYIAAQLVIKMNAAGVSAFHQGSVIHVTPGWIGMSAEDGAGGSAMTVIHQKVASVAELPARRVQDGFSVAVEGGDATGAGDYYLRFNASDGVYQEVQNPAAYTIAPEPGDMPMILVPYSSGFMVKAVDWMERKAGDDNTNPGPSFIGKTINDLFFFEDRMGLLSGEGFDLSQVGEYYNFFRTTVRDLLDTDTVSGIVQHPKVSTLRHAVPFNKRLLYFSDKAQFELATGDFITPGTVATRQLTEFEASSVVRPLGIGTSLYFPVDRGQWSAFYNFFVSGVDSLEDATDISGHVSQYIPKQVTQMVASPVNNILLALSKQDPSALYVYQFYQDGAQRLQSAWHKWTFSGATIQSIGVVGTDLYLLVLRDGVVMIERMPLSLSGVGSLLDRRVTFAPGSYTVTGEGFLAETSLTLPYNAGAGDYYAVVTVGTASRKAGSVVKLTATAGSPTLTLKGDWSGCTFEVGEGYRQTGTLGRFLLREQAGAGSAGVSRGRTQVARMWVNYSEAATFDIIVSPEGREARTYRCTGRNVGSETARLGERALGDGRFGCPVLSENTRVEVTLINDSPLPASFLSVDWEGYHVSRREHV